MSESLHEMKKTFLFVLGVLDYLRANGLVTNGTQDGVITYKGVHTFDQLEASGFRPEAGNVKDAIRYLVESNMIPCDSQFAEEWGEFVTKWDLLKEVMWDKDLPNSEE